MLSRCSGWPIRLRGRLGQVPHTLDHAVGHLGGEQARGDRVHVDVEPRPFDGERLGHPVHRGLRDRIERRTATAVGEATDRGDVDHPPRQLERDQPSGHLARQQERRPQVGVEDPVDRSSSIRVAYWASGMPALFTRIRTGPTSASAWATTEAICSASVTSSVSGRQEPPAVRDLLRDLRQAFDPPCRGDDLRSGGEQRGESPTETGRRAGDEGNLSGEVDRGNDRIHPGHAITSPPRR